MEIQPKDPGMNHFYISMLKSALRIIAGIALIKGFVIDAGFVLIAAEVLGIAEEIV